jgi:hypothetical protein
MTQGHPWDNTELFKGEMPEKHAMLPKNNLMVVPKSVLQDDTERHLGTIWHCPKNLLLVDPKTRPIYLEPRSLNPKV